MQTQRGVDDNYFIIYWVATSYLHWEHIDASACVYWHGRPQVRKLAREVKLDAALHNK